LKILFVASEVAPLAKTGGLADVAGALPRALRRLGHDVRVILPSYRSIRNPGDVIPAVAGPVVATVAGQLVPGQVRELDQDGLPVYLVEQAGYFNRPELYGTADGDYPDNAARFGFFCRAVLDFLRRGPFRPEVLHLNDWQTGLIPVLLRNELAADPKLGRMGTLLTIHNLGYQGLFPPTDLTTLGLGPEYFATAQLEFYGKISLLKGGIRYADLLNTVSATYCREIQTPEMGLGFDGILRDRAADLFGVVNGLDQEFWDPRTDTALPVQYRADDLRGKARCKRLLQQELGLEVQPGVPVVAMVTRIDPQKGLDLVAAAWRKLLKRPMQLVLLGNGQRALMDRFTQLGATAPGRVSINLSFDDRLARRIYGGSDLFLMPSRYEPCGIGQLIALRYGSVPLVRRTGGLADTVTDLTAGLPSANGFLFDRLTTDDLLATIDRALDLYPQRPAWLQLMRNGMRADLSWDRSAQRYLELYARVKAKRRG
jgi:starch synthase